MRSENSIKNIISSFASNILVNILKFVCRIIFVRTISEIYLGVNGLLSNVLGLLALAELGIGTAINYSLYKPIAENDNSKIRSLMKFYRKAYRIIALIVFVMGIILLPFIPYFIKDVTGIKNLELIYIIFVVNQVIGYLFGYKRTIVAADQKNYKLVPFTMVFNILTNIFQILVLVAFKDFIVYLLIQTLFIIIENIVINKYISREYSVTKDLNDAEKLDKKELNIIKKNIKALMYHKVGSYAVNSTDNIIISKFIGIVECGYYSNYYALISIISSFIYTFIGNITASFGNLIVKEKKEKRLSVFNEINFIYYIMYGISTTCFITMFNPFISYAYGPQFVLSMSCVYLITVNFYLLGMTNITEIVKSAAGLYDNDKLVPLFQAVLNIGISIGLGIVIGIEGVLIGTVVSTILPLIAKPIIIYKHVFETKPTVYFKEQLKQIIVLALAVLSSIFIVDNITFTNAIINIGFRLLVSVIVTSIFIFVFYNRSKPYKDALGRVKYLLRKKKSKE